MDPSLSLLKYQNSFTQGLSNKLSPLITYQSSSTIHFTPSFITHKLKPVTSNNPVSDQSDIINKEDNVFNDIGNSIFIHHDAIVLANIDSVANLLKLNFGFALKSTPDPGFTYVIIDGSPGGFVEYIQYRRPNSKGYGINNNSSDWDFNHINIESFIPLNNMNDLFTNWKSYISDILDDNITGVNLILANYPPLYKDDSVPLIIQTIIGLQCSSQDFLLRSIDTTSLISQQILYLLSKCFKSLSIIKPISTSPLSSECYIICQNIKAYKTVSPYIDLLSNSLIKIDYPRTTITSLYKNNIPKDFTSWLSSQNNLIDQYQQNFVDGVYNHTDYIINKALVIWNLPDNIDPLMLNI